MSFKDIKGQDRTIQVLKECMRHSRLAPGYLFLGPEGVGKNLTAKTLAKAVNCLEETFDTSTMLECNGERSRTIDSCDRCISCLKIDNNQHPDVHLISASADIDMSASCAIKIEDIRQLRKDISLKPYEGKTKVFIIDNAHNLTAEAANALLKILEEPPGDSLIILISAKSSLLFKTIISRCQTLKFYPLPRLKLEEMLKKDYGFNSNHAHFLAYFSEGRLGRALRLKDTQILNEKNRIIDDFSFLKKPSLQDPLIQNRENVRNVLNILAGWFRDMYLIKIGTPHSELINLDRRDELLRFMNRYSFANLDEILNSISDSLLLLEQNVNIKLLMSNLREDIRHDY